MSRFSGSGLTRYESKNTGAGLNEAGAADACFRVNAIRTASFSELVISLRPAAKLSLFVPQHLHFRGHGFFRDQRRPEGEHLADSGAARRVARHAQRAR